MPDLTGSESTQTRDIVSVSLKNTWTNTIPTPSFGTEPEVYLPQIRTPFDGNYTQSRRKTTRSIRRWRLRWNAITESQYQTLETFFLANQGVAFFWTEPVTNITYSCRFSEDSIRSVYIDRGDEHFRSVELGLEEV